MRKKIINDISKIRSKLLFFGWFILLTSIILFIGSLILNIAFLQRTNLFRWNEPINGNVPYIYDIDIYLTIFLGISYFLNLFCAFLSLFFHLYFFIKYNSFFDKNSHPNKFTIFLMFLFTLCIITILLLWSTPLAIGNYWFVIFVFPLYLYIVIMIFVFAHKIKLIINCSHSTLNLLSDNTNFTPFKYHDSMLNKRHYISGVYPSINSNNPNLPPNMNNIYSNMSNEQWNVNNHMNFENLMTYRKENNVNLEPIILEQKTKTYEKTDIEQKDIINDNAYDKENFENFKSKFSSFDLNDFIYQLQSEFVPIERKEFLLRKLLTTDDPIARTFLYLLDIPTYDLIEESSNEVREIVKFNTMGSKPIFTIIEESSLNVIDEKNLINLGFINNKRVAVNLKNLLEKIQSTNFDNINMYKLMLSINKKHNKFLQNKLTQYLRRKGYLK